MDSNSTKKTDVIFDSFTSGQAANATGLPYSQIAYWAKTGFLVPSVKKAQGSNTCRVYSFRDLVALRVAGQMRDAGISLPALRKVVKHLQKRYEQPLADAFLIVMGNGDVVERNGDTVISALHSPGQAYFIYALGEAWDSMKSIAGTLKRPARGKACNVA